MKSLSLLMLFCVASASAIGAEASAPASASVTSVSAPPAAPSSAAASVSPSPAPKLVATITAADMGTYALLDKDDKPTDTLYRLSKPKGKWKIESKIGQAPFKDVSCGPKCVIEASGPHQILAMFPPGWVANAEIGCVQNATQAFCHYLTRIKEGKDGFVFVTILNNESRPHFLQKEMPKK